MKINKVYLLLENFTIVKQFAFTFTLILTNKGNK